ncbi:MAG: recombinase family protein [Candidatus Paceibacterota bacterium]
MKEEIKIKKLVALYARVSTERQEVQKTIKTQLLAIKDFAEKQGYAIVERYIDNGWSGGIFERPELDRLRQDAQSKKRAWEAVIIYDPDRLSRIYSHQAFLTEELQKKVEIIFITISTPKNDEDKILYGVRGLFAEYERMKIKERFRLGKLRKVKEGHILTTEAPFGYNYIKRNENVHGYYKINENEARIIRDVFHWVADEKLTLRAVVRRLKEMNIKPRKSKRGVWNTTTLGTILRNKTYIGEAHYGKSYAVEPEKPLKQEKYRKIRKTSRKIRPEEEWIKIPVPAIIDSYLFERVERQLKNNYEQSKRNRKNDYLLAGKIWCSCGCRRVGEGAQKGKHLYYRCSARNLNFPLPVECKERGINAKVVDSKLWERMVRFMSSPELLQEQVNRWGKSRKNRVNESVKDKEIVKKEVLKLKEERERYTKAYGAGVLTLEQLKWNSDEIGQKITSLEKEITAYETQEGQTEKLSFPTKEEIEVFANKAKNTLNNLNFEEKSRIVKDAIDKIVGYKEKLKVIGKLPITTLNYVGLQTINGNSGVAECGKVYAF